MTCADSSNRLDVDVGIAASVVTDEEPRRALWLASQPDNFLVSSHPIVEHQFVLRKQWQRRQKYRIHPHCMAESKILGTVLFDVPAAGLAGCNDRRCQNDFS